MIFVNIAAYRDPETYHTVLDLFEKAKYPNAIHVTVCWQYNSLREEPFVVTDRKSQVSVINVDYKKARGVCWARHMVQKLYDGEQYYLQIDAHSRFIPNWDEVLIEELSRCSSDKPILSTYPDHYTLPNTLVPQGPYKLIFNTFHNRVPCFHSRVCTEEEKTSPSSSAIVSGGFQFCKADAILAVPYDPMIYFIGEEITLSARYWTHGYDIFTPTKTILFHLYTLPESQKIHHWNDHPDWHTEYEHASHARVLQLLGVETTANARALTDIDRYGIGTQRTLGEYELFAGVNFKEQQFTDKAREGITSAC